jgi:RimJ/RimL family protein N-acetyltransferase
MPVAEVALPQGRRFRDRRGMSEHRDAYGRPVGFPVPNWTPRPHPPRTPMLGRYARVEPLDIARHAAELDAVFRAGDPGSWSYLGAEPFASTDAFRAYLAAAAASADPLAHTIVDVASGAAVGMASFMRIDPRNGVIEVGGIHLSERLQRTPAATEAMFLMMRRAFDELGYRRYEWKCDSLNAPSRAAAERYGFTFEGIFRQAVVYKGRNRDTAWYAIIDRDWPAIKAAFEAWLDPANFDAAGRQRRRLADFRR